MELAPSVCQFLSWKKQKAERDAWQHFVLGCLNSAPPWEIPAGSDPAPPGHPKGSPGQPLGHKSLWDLLENREKREGKPTQTAVMGDLSAQGWSWVGSGATSATSAVPVSIRQDTGPEGLEQDRQGQEGSQESPSHITAALDGDAGQAGAPWAQHHSPEQPWLLPWQLPKTGTVPCSKPDPLPAPQPQGGVPQPGIPPKGSRSCTGTPGARGEQSRAEQPHTSS